MAYASRVSLAQTIDQIQNDHPYSNSPNDKQQIIRIHEFITFLQAFLEYFGEKASGLEVRIVDVANETEDIIEYSMLEQYLRYHIEKVMQEFESIAGEAMDIKNRIKDLPVIRDLTAATSSSRFAPTVKHEMVDFSYNLIAIKERLFGESSKLQVIPIFGMEGIGKTTLAGNAYDDPITMKYFDIHSWVTVPQDYSVREILSSLIASMKFFKAAGSEEGNESIMAQELPNTDRSEQGNETIMAQELPNADRSEQYNESIMAKKTYQNLKGRRYLIVLDDMRSTKAWDDLKMVFPNDNNGSRIMKTTRLSDVAAYPDSSSPLHTMQFMDEDQSWNLLRQRVFKQDICQGRVMKRWGLRQDFRGGLNKKNIN